jgi:hypothetical protein
MQAHPLGADRWDMLGLWFRKWLARQSLGLRVLVSGVFAGITVWLAFETGKFALLVMGLVIAVLAFNRDDVERARAWLSG